MTGAMLPCDELGDGKSLVLLHAGIADRTMWAAHLAPLAEAGHRVVAVDLPGFGEACPNAERAPWDLVLDTMDVLSIDRATLVGNSLGGAVGLRIAVVAPARVEGLVLVSTPPLALDPSPTLLAAWEAEASALERGDLDAAVDAVVAAWTLPDAPAALRSRVAAMQRRAFELQLGAPSADDLPDPLDGRPDVLSELRVRALVVAGGRDLPDFVEGARQLADGIRGAAHAMIDDAGHLAPLEAPTAFRALLLSFLAGG
jgi:pimeloyl-ACP methyl ester carboxylesterase